MKNFKNSLSRTEMKTIFAGGGVGPEPIGELGGKCSSCRSHSDCASGVCATWSKPGVCEVGRRCL